MYPKKQQFLSSVHLICLTRFGACARLLKSEKNRLN
jgi:hypothetical protein